MVPSPTFFCGVLYTKLQHALIACLLWFLGDMDNTRFYPNGPGTLPLFTAAVSMTLDVTDRKTMNVVWVPREPTIEDLHAFAQWIREDSGAWDCMILVGTLHPVGTRKSHTNPYPQLHGILMLAENIRQGEDPALLPIDAIQYGWHVYMCLTNHCLVFSHSHTSTNLPPIALPPLSKLGLKVWRHTKEDRFMVVPHTVNSPLPEWDASHNAACITGV